MTAIPTRNPDSVDLLRRIADAWTATNPRDRRRLDSLQNAMAASLASADPARVLQSLTAAELDSPLGAAALDRWLSSDPVAAARWVATRPEPSFDQAWAVSQRLLENPADFEEFCADLADTPWKQVFLAQSGTAVLALDPVAALEIGARMAPGDSRTGLLRQAFARWVASDPEAAVAWFGNLDDPNLRVALVDAATAEVMPQLH